MAEELRFHVSADSRCIYDHDFTADVVFRIDGDFADEYERMAYAAAIASELNRRAPQPEPAAPTPDTFMGEPVLMRWKPLNRDDSRLALHQSMHNRSFGNPSDDKLMLEWLWENGYALCKRVPDEAAPTPQQQALDRMVENAETLGLYEAAPTEATLDQMAGKAWDRFQRHTAELQALENCRLYAARHRKEDWAATILRFCADGGATGSPLREAAPTVVEPLGWTVADAADRLKNGNVVEVSLEKEQPDDVPLYLAATPPRAALGERTTQVLNDLQSALGMMLTFFGMDEDENSESVFDTARQAYQYAQIVLRPIEPHEREALAKLRSTLHQWHESAVAKGFDGVASMLDSVAAAPTVVEPEPVAAYRPTCDVLLRGVGTGWPDFIAPQRLFTPNDVLYAAPPRTPLTEELEALRELVACEDMRLEVQSVRSDPYYLTEADALELQYEQRRDKAWDRARAVIAADRGQG